MRLTSTLALALVASSALAACTAGSADGGASSSSAAPAPVAASAQLDPDAKGPAVPVPGGRRGGSLRVRTENGPSTLDPTRQYYVDSQAILKLTNRTLTTFVIRDGKAVLVPDLATDLGRVSADGKTWTFTLKEGVTYEDGTPVRAADVAYAVMRSFAQQELMGGPTYQIEHLVGGHDYKGPYQGGTSFPGVEVKGEREVILHLTEPWPSLPYFASFTVFSPIPADKDTRERYEEHPLATGPYKFESYEKGKSLTLVRNDRWKPETDPARHDLLDKLSFEFGQDSLEVQGGILDGTGEGARTLSWDPVASPLVDRATAAKGQLVQGVSPCMEMISMDTRQIPLSVRRAVAVAYPWDSVHKAGELSRLAITPTRSYMPPQLPGAVSQDVPGIPIEGDGDPVAAKAMLEKEGKSGFELSWYYSQDNPLARAQSDARAAGLRKAGFQVRTIGLPREQIREAAMSLDAPVNMQQGPKGWCFDWPNGDAIYPALFSSTARRESMTIGGLADPELDARMRSIAAKPLDQQAAEWVALDKDLIAKHLPALPGGNDKATYLFGSRVGGVVNDPNLGMPDLSGLYVKE